MNSRTRREFWDRYAKLPPNVRQQARAAFQQFERDPWYPSLQFKMLNRRANLYSARIGLGHRALGTRINDQVVWFWIGTHAEYDHLTADL